MQNKIGKRTLSLLLVFAMVFSVASQMLSISVRASITNPSLSAAIGTINTANTTWDLRGKNIVGEVNLDEVKTDYPHVTFVNLSYTNVTNVINTSAGINSQQNNTFVLNSNRRSLVNDGLNLTFDSTSTTASITLGEILGHISVQGATDAFGTPISVPLSDVIEPNNGTSVGVYVELNSSTLTGAGAYYDVTALTTNVFTSANFTSLTAGTTVPIYVQMDYKNGGSTPSYTTTVSVDLKAPYITLTTNMYGSSSPYFVYEGDTIEVKAELFDALGSHMNLSAGNYSIDIHDGTTTVTPLSLAQNVNSNGVLEFSFAASDFTTIPTTALARISVTDGVTGAVGTVLFDVDIYYYSASSMVLEEHQGSTAIALPQTLTGVPGATANPTTIFVNGSSSISSSNSLNVGTTGSYNDATIYTVESDLGSVSYQLRGMFSLSPLNNYSAEWVDDGSGNLALRISAGSSAVAETLTITYNDSTGSIGEIDLRLQSVVFQPHSYEIYQIPAKFYESNTLTAVESAINSNPSQNGIKKVSRYDRGTTVVNNVYNYNQNTSDSSLEEAEIPEGGYAYYVPVSIASSSTTKRVLVADDAVGVNGWYDSNNMALAGFSNPSNFTQAGGVASDVTGEQLAAPYKQVLLARALTGSFGDEVKAGLIISILGGGSNTITLDITIIESVAEYFYLVGTDMTGTNVVTHYDYITGSPTAAGIPIGLSSEFTLHAHYSNGSDAPVPYSSLSNLNVVNDNYPSLAGFFTVSGGSTGELLIKATDRGGPVDTAGTWKDAYYGETSTISFTDDKGTQGTIQVMLDLPVVTDLKYYLVSETGIDSIDTSTLTSLSGSGAAPTISSNRVFDYANPIIGSGTTPYSNEIELPKGEYFAMYVVPVFSSEDRNDQASNDPYNFSTYYEEVAVEGVNQTRTDPWGWPLSSIMDYWNPVTSQGANLQGASNYADAATKIGHNASFTDYAVTGDLIDCEIWTYDVQGSGLNLDNMVLAGDVSVNSYANATPYYTYDLTTGSYGANLSALFAVKATEHYMTELEVEDYTGRSSQTYLFYGNDQFTSANTILATGSAASGNVGVEKSFRVKIGYSDGEELDSAVSRYYYPALNQFKDGVLFMMDSESSYNAANGPTLPNWTTPGAYAIGEIDPVDVLRAYLTSNEGVEYGNAMAIGATVQSTLNYGLSGSALNQILEDEMSKLTVKVYEVSGNWTDVTSLVNFSWSAPGVFKLTPNQPGIFRVIFYEEVTVEGQTFEVPALDFTSSGLYYFDINIDSVVDSIALVGEDVTPYTVTSNPTGFEYLLDKSLPDSFKVLPVVYDSIQVASADITGKVKSDIANIAGADFMYYSEFQNLMSHMQVASNTSTLIPTLTHGPVTITHSDGSQTTEDLIYIDCRVVTVGQGAVELTWDNLSLIPGLTLGNTYTIDKTNASSMWFGSAANGGIHDDQELYYNADTSKRVYDIILGTPYSTTRFDSIGNELDINAAGAYINEKVRIEVKYRLEDGSTRPLTDSELSMLAASATGHLSNQLKMTEAGSNLNYSTDKAAYSTISYIYITPTDRGSFTFELETVNTAGSPVPSASMGTRSVSFNVDEQIPGDQYINYGEVITINCNLAGGLTPVYTVISNPNNVLDTLALANGILRMAVNETATAVVELYDSNNVLRTTFNVYMTQSTGTGTLVPGTYMLMDDGDYIRLREKVVYSSGAVEYYDVSVAFGNAIGDVDFLNDLGNGVVMADGSLASAGDVGTYTVTSASGAGYTFTAEYSGNPSTATYVTYSFDTPTLSMVPGETKIVQIVNSALSTIDLDDLYLVYTNGSLIATMQTTAAPDQLQITALAPGNVTVKAENSKGESGTAANSTLAITINNPISCSITASTNTAAAGDTVTFTATASGGSGSYSYTWEYSSDNVTWGTISGASNATLTLSNVATSDSGYYRCVVTDATGVNTATSNVAALTVTGGGAGTYSISGTVYEVSTNNPIMGATVNLIDSSNNQIATTATDGNGDYSFANIASGTYTINASKIGYASGSRSNTVNSNITGADFYLSPVATYTIDGIIDDNLGNLVSGAALTLTMTNISGTATVGTATSDLAGYYSIANVPDGAYVLSVDATPSGYAIMQVNVTVAGSNVTVNVTLDDNPPAPIGLYSIAGIVYDIATTLPINGATVTIPGLSVSATTNASGNYVISNVPDGGTYVVVATKSGYDPGSRGVTVSGANVTGHNIGLDAAATYTVSGTVYEGSWTGPVLAGVAVSLDGSATLATTDSNGNYSIPGVSAGSYILTFSKAGYAAKSPSITVSGNLTVDAFLLAGLTPGPYSVSGKITNNVTGSGISGATVTLSTSAGAYTPVTTDSNGNYTIANVANDSYTLTASATGYTTGSTSVVVNGANVTGANVSLIPSGGSGTYTVSGQVTDSSSGSGLSGATVRLTGSMGTSTTSTDTNGNYSFSGIADGTYSMTVTRTGYTSRTVTVTVNGANVTQDVALSASSGGGSSGGGGGGGGGGSTGSRSAVISLSKTTVKVGESISASVSLRRGSALVQLADDADFTWSINDDSIAAIMKDNGETITIEGLKAGVTTVEITVVQDGLTYKGTVKLTVIGDSNVVTPVEPGPVTPPVTGSKFSDVASSFWGYDAIMYLANKAVVSGYENGTFRPNAEITRNEFVTMLSKAMGWGKATPAQLESAAAHFADWSSVPEWAREFWALAHANNLMNGSLNEGKYYAEGGRNISRQEVCVVFAKLVDDEGSKDLTFSDAGQVASWAADSVKKCAANGLISGYTDNTFKPLNSITRAESAAIFYKYLTK